MLNSLGRFSGVIPSGSRLFLQNPGEKEVPIGPMQILKRNGLERLRMNDKIANNKKEFIKA